MKINLVLLSSQLASSSKLLSLWRCRVLQRHHHRHCWTSTSLTAPDFLCSRRMLWPGWRPLRGRRSCLRGHPRWSLYQRRSCSRGCNSRRRCDTTECVWSQTRLKSKKFFPSNARIFNIDFWIKTMPVGLAHLSRLMISSPQNSANTCWAISPIEIFWFGDLFG